MLILRRRLHPVQEQKVSEVPAPAAVVAHTVVGRRIAGRQVALTSPPAPPPAVNGKLHDITLRQHRSEAARAKIKKLNEELIEHPPQRREVQMENATERKQRADRAKANIDKQLKLIAEAEYLIDTAHEDIEQAYKVVEAQLKLVNLAEHSNGVHVARIVDQYSNRQRAVDPKRFKARVTDKDFWDCIEVSITKAKTVLTETEIDSISVIKEPALIATVLKVERIDRVKRKPRTTKKK